MSLSASCQCCDVDTKGFFMWPVNGVRRERKREREGMRGWKRREILISA